MVALVFNPREVDLCVFKVSLVCKMNFRITRTVTQRNPVSENKTTNKRHLGRDGSIVNR